MSASINISDPKPGDVLDGKYKVQRVLGRGGMGVVVAATHLDLQESVALKFLLPDAAQQPDSIERFLREARAVRKLNSEHVVKVLDVGRLAATGMPYMTMELLKGEDLSEHLSRSGPLLTDVACGYIVQACEALDEAHRQQIIHRDIKPANLFMVNADRGNTTIKVLDFGIAKVLGTAIESGTKTNTMVGSAFYMSPEQMRSAKSVDKTTDIWALGVTLFELLTGHWPFTADSLPGLALAVASQPPVSPAVYRPDLPEPLVRIILRCLEKLPNDRYQTIPAFVTDLLPFLAPIDRALAQQIVQRGNCLHDVSRIESPIEDSKLANNYQALALQETIAASLVTAPTVSANVTESANAGASLQDNPKQTKRNVTMVSLAVVIFAVSLFALNQKKNAAISTPSQADLLPIVIASVDIAPSASGALPITSTSPATTNSSKPITSSGDSNAGAHPSGQTAPITKTHDKSQPKPENTAKGSNTTQAGSQTGASKLGTSVD